MGRARGEAGKGLWVSGTGGRGRGLGGRARRRYRRHAPRGDESTEDRNDRDTGPPAGVCHDWLLL